MRPNEASNEADEPPGRPADLDDEDLHLLTGFADIAQLAGRSEIRLAGRVVGTTDGQVILAEHVSNESLLVSVEDPSLLTLVPGDVIALSIHRDNEGLVGKGLRRLVACKIPTDPVAARARTASQTEVQLYGGGAPRRALHATDRLLYAARTFLRNRGYVEVLLPVFNEQADISPNVPFETTSAGGNHFYLRTTFPYFERLFFSVDRAFQIGPMFRDEAGASDRSPEFNMLCLGRTYSDYTDMMEFGEEFLAHLASEVVGRTELRVGGLDIDLSQPWRRRAIGELLMEYARVDLADAEDHERLHAIVVEHGLAEGISYRPGVYSHIAHSQLLDALLKHYVYPRMLAPTFVTEFPYYYGGPARPTERGSHTKMRAEGFIGGIEVGETVAFLTAPESIRQWHRSVREAKELTGLMQAPDADFLDTMDRGIHPAAVIAFGIERLLMLFLETSEIADVMLFPGRASSSGF